MRTAGGQAGRREPTIHGESSTGRGGGAASGWGGRREGEGGSGATNQPTNLTTRLSFWVEGLRQEPTGKVRLMEEWLRMKKSKPFLICGLLDQKKKEFKGFVCRPKEGPRHLFGYARRYSYGLQNVSSKNNCWPASSAKCEQGQKSVNEYSVVVDSSTICAMCRFLIFYRFSYRLWPRPRNKMFDK